MKNTQPGHQIRSVKLISIDSIFVISSPNPMFDHLLESSRWDDSNKWSNIGFGEEIGIMDVKLELGVPRNTCVTCPGSFRKLTKGNNSKNIDARVMDHKHGSWPT